MMSTPLGMIISFVLTIAILVTFHEFGHFWVARKLGVKVLKFSVGFGKPLFKWFGKDGVEYVIAAIPLGGYVKMLDERVGEVTTSERHQAFNAQSVWKRIAIVCAGPLANFLLAILLYWIIFIVGITGIKPIIGEVLPNTPAYEAKLPQYAEIVSVDDKQTLTWQSVIIALIEKLGNDEDVVLTVKADDRTQRHVLPAPTAPQQVEPYAVLDSLGIKRLWPDIPAVVGEAISQGAAFRAGLMSGDRIVQVEGETVHDWLDFVEKIKFQPEKSLNLVVMRAGQTINVTLTPEAKEGPDGDVIGFIGARPQPIQWPDEYQVEISYPASTALAKAFIKTWDVSVLTLKMLHKMISGLVSHENLGGPIAIAQGAGRSMDAGFISFLGFLALVSVSLGVLNLLPIPVLDGGHLLFYVIEIFTGKVVSERVQLAAVRLGVVLLIAITLLAFYNDFARI